MVISWAFADMFIQLNWMQFGSNFERGGALDVEIVVGFVATLK